MYIHLCGTCYLAPMKHLDNCLSRKEVSLKVNDLSHGILHFVEIQEEMTHAGP